MDTKVNDRARQASQWKRKLVGRAAVDSGRLMVVDPAYVSYKPDIAQGLDVTADTFGDGMFPVYLETQSLGPGKGFKNRIVIELYDPSENEIPTIDAGTV